MEVYGYFFTVGSEVCSSIPYTTSPGEPAVRQYNVYPGTMVAVYTLYA